MGLERFFLKSTIGALSSTSAYGIGASCSALKSPKFPFSVRAIKLIEDNFGGCRFFMKSGNNEGYYAEDAYYSTLNISLDELRGFSKLDRVWRDAFVSSSLANKCRSSKDKDVVIEWKNNFWTPSSTSRSTLSLGKRIDISSYIPSSKRLSDIQGRDDVVYAMVKASDPNFIPAKSVDDFLKIAKDYRNDYSNKKVKPGFFAINHQNYASSLYALAYLISERCLEILSKPYSQNSSYTDHARLWCKARSNKVAE